MRRLALLTAAALLASAPAADAALPSPKSTKLKPGSSFAGVKLGASAKSALASWGKGGSCDGVDPAQIIQQDCNWEGTATTGKATIGFRDGKVYDINLFAGQKSNGECVYKGALVKWKDAKGLKLGSAVSTVARKYPKGFANGSGWQLNSGKHATLWDSSGGRACRISLAYLSALG